jgi:hypothetical protein
MAELTNFGPQPIKTAASNVEVSSSSIAKRSIADLLPSVNRTQVMTKFLNTTADHLFQPENVEFLSGYVGAKPSYYDPNRDFYIPEVNRNRTDYQLTPALVSKDASSEIIDNVMFYDDLIDQLRTQGAITSNPSRLLDGDYYSWSPPIDLDKFLNFYEYYWLPDGPGAILLMDPTDLAANAAGRANYTYDGRYQRMLDGVIMSGTLKFSSGMRIRTLIDADPSLAGRTLIVEGVGRSIMIEPDVIFQNPSWDTQGWNTLGWDGDTNQSIPDYFTIGRLSLNSNRWSFNNRWFHRAVIEQSGISVTGPQAIQALRPIIEFNPEVRLWNMGTQSRPSVDLIDTINSDIYGSVAGKSSYRIDGTDLIDGMLILATADADSDINGRIYRVGGIEQYGVITLEPIDEQGRSSTAPETGDCVYVKFGRTNGDQTYWFNGTSWVRAQRFTKNQPPLFEGYDWEGISLSDPTFYQGSTHAGNAIFAYATDESSAIDPVLGIRVKVDQFGDYVFDNHLATKTYQFVVDGTSRTIDGQVWYRDGAQLGNGWYKSRAASRQYVVNTYDPTGPTTTFLIDQRPAAYVQGNLPTITVAKTRSGKSNALIYGVDYAVNGRIVILTEPAQSGDRIEIRSWSDGARSSDLGYYQIPINLLNNPNNQEPAAITFNQMTAHFSEMIRNQDQGSVGGFGTTNWRDSSQIRGLGQSILQHRSPLLKLMLLNSTNLNAGLLSGVSPLDPSLAMQFAQREYTRFYNRFLRSLFNLYASGLGPMRPPEDWIASALKQINLGKSKASAWAYSGYEQNWDFSPTAAAPTFVPPTAARLGVAPVYAPYVYQDMDYNPPLLTIQTHDGARVVMQDSDGLPLGKIFNDRAHTANPAMLTHPVAAAWLKFELDVYASMTNTYQSEDHVLAFDQRELVPGKWRATEYQRSEYLDILRPSFDKWTIQSQVDWRANTIWEINNQFSFNYSTCFDADGVSVPGHWRGIYRWFYDTDRPHTHPWEMLGFSQKPSWWDAEYGAAPYTRGNSRLWEDLRDGVIRQGGRAGSHYAWSRPGLMRCIPVDDQGDLLPPMLAGVITGLPSISDSQAGWEFGDCGPIENVWLNSTDYGFVRALSGYLMKPARFIEHCWDPMRVVIAGDGDSQQHIYIDTNRRRSSREFYVHRENPAAIGNGMTVSNESTLTFYGSWGIQHWISEYLVSQNLNVTNYFGNVIRGSDVQLGHKFGGFVTTDNSLRVMVDSFGQIGYSSQMVPSENIRTYLYRSPSIESYFYSGVIAIKQRDGYRIYGYDGVNQYFNTIPSVQTGPKSTIVIGNQSVTDYKDGQGLARVPYGTVLSTRQDVYDFLVSYGRWLENQGWVFDNVNSDSGKITDWRQSARDFVYWSQGNWSDGNFVALSPAAEGAKFSRDFGSIQYLNGTVGGTYPVIDRNGQPIEQQNLEILRQDGEVTINSINNQSFYGVRLFASTIEHIMLVDNTTQFNDTIYDPLYGVYQPRLRVYTYRTNGWNGRLDAPGYFLYQDPITEQWSMIGNLEKTAEDFRNLYNVDQPKNVIEIDPSSGRQVTVVSDNHAVTRSDLSDLARHTFGFQGREYLKNLIADETTEFEFYQGFIRQKGTLRSVESMLRNSNIMGAGPGLRYHEEYALRIGRFGAVDLNTNIDFILEQSEFGNSPQRIDVFGLYDSDRSRSGAITLVPRDSRIVVPPENYEGKMFTLRDSYESDFYGDLPSAGYVRLGEAKWYATDRAALLGLRDSLAENGISLAEGDRVWQFITPAQTWDIYKLVSPAAACNGTLSTEESQEYTVVTFDGPHGLVVGDIVVCDGFINNDSLNTTFVLEEVTLQTITVPVSTFIAEESGQVLVYRSMRFASGQDVKSASLPTGWSEGDLIYVDNGRVDSECLALDPSYEIESYQWVVYKRYMGNWIPIRKAQKKIAADLMLKSMLYDKNDLNLLTYVDYFDPAKGIIPGVADREITYKSSYDPANYNNGDQEIYSLVPDSAWTSRHVGEVWWDLSTTRYIDYEQGDIDYRIRNWGKLAPGTTVMIYEWVRSPIPPSDWASFALNGTNLSQFGVNYVPSGTIRNPDDPAWTESVEYDTNGNRRTWYYFWVSNSDLKPTVEHRQLTTNEIARVIINPESSDLAWYAAISERTLIVANVYRYLDADNTVMQVVYTNKPNDANDHKEWSLIRDGDPYCRIDDVYWNKLRDSLTGFDAAGNIVPDPWLNPLQRYGNLIRPRQSWFRDRLAALKLWVDGINRQLAEADTPLTQSPQWDLVLSNYLSQGEPIPSSSEWDHQVSSMSELRFIPTANLGDQAVRALVLPVAENAGLWTIWTYMGEQWTLTRQQSYSVPKYWEYSDWYLSGYDKTLIPTYRVPSEIARGELMLAAGETVEVSDNGDGRWAIYANISGEDRLVGLEAGTIQVSNALWDGNINLCGYDRRSYDITAYDYNPTVEIGIIFDALTQGIYDRDNSLELNQQFFAMLNYVFSEQRYVDWAIKTSYIVVSGTDEQLDQGQLYRPNMSDYLLDYINEAKPYRTKVRDFVSGRSTDDQANMHITDFDKPVLDGRIFDPLILSDANTMVTDSNYSDWYLSYLTNGQLIRRIKTQLVFDRISAWPRSVNVINVVSSGSTAEFRLSIGDASSFRVGEAVRIYGVVSDDAVQFNGANIIVSASCDGLLTVSYGSNIGLGEGTGGTIYHQAWGAAERVLDSYDPTRYMAPAFTPELIKGSDYSGHVYAGTNFNLEPGWGVAPWDFVAGWDADAAAFDQYLDLILQGGMPPVYDQFYGTGIRTKFRLSRVPQDLLHTRVWRDHVLAEYGRDYTVPNWAERMEIVDPGQGYELGDLVDLVEDTVDPNTLPARVRVLELDPTGGIRRLELVRKGYYPLIQHGGYVTKNVDYTSSTGTGARLQPVWGGDTLVFNDPPLGSSTPNIWVLYAGTTFDPPPEGTNSLLIDGYDFIQPTVEEDHAEELYLARLTNAVRIDTYSAPIGGRPLVYTRSYRTDGIRDQFDLGLRPQSPAAVFAYLDGQRLVHGVTNDYVINFEAGRLVFLRPPAANRVLTTMAIGEGGGGRGVFSAYVDAPGEFYNPGDVIELDGDAVSIPTISVDTVAAVGIQRVEAGRGYKTGDLLILEKNGSVYSKRLAIRIARVSNTGSILEWHIEDPGSYEVLPSSNSWQTTGRGVGAVFDVVWGIDRVSVISKGLYATKPVSPVGQRSVSPASGAGATFKLTFTSVLSQQTWIAGLTTDNTVSYELTVEPRSAGELSVTVDGISVDPVLTGRTITIPSPDQGRCIVATVFDTDQFSRVESTEILIVQDGEIVFPIVEYDLDRAAYNTVPDYLGTIVTTQGRTLSPPTTNTYIGNGYARIFAPDRIPPNLGDLKVYVGSVLNTYDPAGGIDTYDIADGSVIFNYSPAAGMQITMVMVDTYDYMLEGTKIIFNPDKIALDAIVTVTNFSQDLDYGFAVETFQGATDGVYELAAKVSSESTVSVTVNGGMLKLLWDYTVMAELQSGLQVQAFELSPFQLGEVVRYFVKINSNFQLDSSDQIVIRYMAGQPARPPVAFRQFIDRRNLMSSQALSDAAKTLLLSDLSINSDSIEVADLAALTMPTDTVPGMIWVGNELIEFREARAMPTVENPKRGLLTNLLRNSGGTSGDPRYLYDCDFWDGDGSTLMYPTPTSDPQGGETVTLDGRIQLVGSVQWQISTGSSDTIALITGPSSSKAVRVYENGQLLSIGNDYVFIGLDQIKLTPMPSAGAVIKIEIDSDQIKRSQAYVGIYPPGDPDGTGQPTGRYLVFDSENIPPIGIRNIKLATLVKDTAGETLCHPAGTLVQDAGTNVQIPGGYVWEPAGDGLQNSDSPRAKFLLANAGTRG